MLGPIVGFGYSASKMSIMALLLKILFAKSNFQIAFFSHLRDLILKNVSSYLTMVGSYSRHWIQERMSTTVKLCSIAMLGHHAPPW